ncbi:hypothetical protein RU639_008507 [Aspergillus parasiticus]
MEPLSALGLATAVIQITQFTGQLIRGTSHASQAADGLLLSNANILDVAGTLLSLTEQLVFPPSFVTLSGEERLLHEICLECCKVSESLLDRLGKLQRQQPLNRWDQVRQTFGQLLGQGETNALATKLGNIREQLNTALLICLRNQLSEVFSRQTDPGALRFLSQIQQVWNAGKPWYSELLLAIHRNDWDAHNQHDLKDFAAALDNGTEGDRESDFCEAILALLKFPGLPDRHEAIPVAHKNTFEWTFHNQAEFPNWLLRGQNEIPFWITGKPGSGKSTLMKFLYNEPRTRGYLKRWAGSQPLILGGFFFWNSGTVNQMSQRGLLQSLLFQVLHDHRQYIRQVFPERWQRYNHLRRGLHDWTIAELQQALEMIISQALFRFAFFLDGLDEFDGNPQVLVEFMGRITEKDNVKLCVASRPWNLFQDAFEQSPSLRLEQLTYGDIRLYVSERCRQNRRFVNLLQREPDRARDLETAVVDKASGVFLWVYLVVGSLLAGIQNGDSIADLRKRLAALPSDLEQLFEKLLNTVDAFYFESLCHLMQLVRHAYQPLNLLTFYYTDEAVENALTDPIRPLGPDQVTDFHEEARRRLNSRSKGLLEAPSSPKGTIQYLHRTAKDFLHSPKVWVRITAGSNAHFDANYTLASAYLRHLKTLKSSRMATEEFWIPAIGCLEHSVRAMLQSATGEQHNQVLLLKELDRSSRAIWTATTPGDQCALTGRVPRRAERWPCTLGTDYTFDALCVRLKILPFVRYQLEQNHPDQAAYVALLLAALGCTTLPPHFAAAHTLLEVRTPDPDTVALILSSCPNPDWIRDMLCAFKKSCKNKQLQAMLSAYLRRTQKVDSRLRPKAWVQDLLKNEA